MRATYKHTEHLYQVSLHAVAALGRAVNRRARRAWTLAIPNLRGGKGVKRELFHVSNVSHIINDRLIMVVDVVQLQGTAEYTKSTLRCAMTYES